MAHSPVVGASLVEVIVGQLRIRLEMVSKGENP